VRVRYVPKNTIGTSRELNGPSVGCLILLRVHWADHAIYYGVAAFRVQMVPHLSSCASTERHVSYRIYCTYAHIFLSSVYIQTLSLSLQRLLGIAFLCVLALTVVLAAGLVFVRVIHGGALKAVSQDILVATFRTIEPGRILTPYTLSLSTISSSIFTSCVILSRTRASDRPGLNSFLNTVPEEQSLSSPFFRCASSSFFSIVEARRCVLYWTKGDSRCLQARLPR
jgi:hypothetical protein